MNRFAAKLLFQFRIAKGGKSNQRRTCEERIVLLESRSAEAAYQRAVALGKNRQFSYDALPGTKVHVEFVGVLDLLRLDVACEPDEVWYDIVEILRPKERARRLIPPKAKLDALFWERVEKSSKRKTRRRRA